MSQIMSCVTSISGSWVLLKFQSYNGERNHQSSLLLKVCWSSAWIPADRHNSAIRVGSKQDLVEEVRSLGKITISSVRYKGASNLFPNQWVLSNFSSLGWRGSFHWHCPRCHLKRPHQIGLTSNCPAQNIQVRQQLPWHKNQRQKCSNHLLRKESSTHWVQKHPHHGSGLGCFSLLFLLSPWFYHYFSDQFSPANNVHLSVQSESICCLL